MPVASILCVDGELDVHDTARAAVTAAIERRREVAGARIGISAGDIEVGDPLGFAKRLYELATPGAILVSDTIRRATGGDHAFVGLGAISTAGYLDRIHVYELDGAIERQRTAVALEMAPHGRIGIVGAEAEERAREEAELRTYDHRIWGIASAHRGFVDRSQGHEHLIAFADPIDAFHAALAALAEIERSNLGHLHIGIDHGTMTYMADHWWSGVWTVAQRIRARQYRRIASSMRVVEALGIPRLGQLGLVIEVVEEVTQKGVRDPVRVAQLRIE